jgi:hypothetical protein
VDSRLVVQVAIRRVSQAPAQAQCPVNNLPLNPALNLLVSRAKSLQLILVGSRLQLRRRTPLSCILWLCRQRAGARRRLR